MTELGKDVRFFVEEAKAGDRRPERLQEVLNGQTLELLEQKGWGVSIATLGLENSETADRTGLVLHNAFKGHKNVPFTLWIAGCEGDYWTDPLRDPTLGKTKAKIAQAESWADYYRIPVSGIGLDIEPSLGESREMNKGLRNLGIVALRRIHSLRRMEKLSRLGNSGENPFQALADLVNDLEVKNLKPEVYVAPTDILRKALGLIVPEKTNVFTMVYTCSMQKVVARAVLTGLVKIPGLLKPKEHIAFGNVSSTGKDSGVDFEGGNLLPGGGGPKELIRDIRIFRLAGGDLSQFRVFALTGPEIVQATMDALESNS